MVAGSYSCSCPKPVVEGTGNSCNLDPTAVQLGRPPAAAVLAALVGCRLPTEMKQLYIIDSGHSVVLDIIKKPCTPDWLPTEV